VKNLRLFANNFYSDGGGRYIFGQGPDLIIQGDGSPSLIQAYSMVHGLEYQVTPKTLLFGYYGGAYFQKNVAIDPETGGPVGYGYSGSPSEHNRSIQQVTAGPRLSVFWGHCSPRPAFLFAAVACGAGSAGQVNLNMFYLNLRHVPWALPSAR
jgi:hypothetical protein